MLSPRLRPLSGTWYNGFIFHRKMGMLIKIDTETAKEYRIVCHECYGIGHKGSDCAYNKGQSLICLNCGGKHHPRNCYRTKNAKTIKVEQPAETSKPIETAPTPRETHNERQKKAREATMDFKKRFRNLRKPQKDGTGSDDW